jgi:hypothetical protein
VAFLGGSTRGDRQAGGAGLALKKKKKKRKQRKNMRARLCVAGSQTIRSCTGKQKDDTTKTRDQINSSDSITVNLFSSVYLFSSRHRSGQREQPVSLPKYMKNTLSFHQPVYSTASIFCLA